MEVSTCQPQAHQETATVVHGAVPYPLWECACPDYLRKSDSPSIEGVSIYPSQRQSDVKYATHSLSLKPSKTPFVVFYTSKHFQACAIQSKSRSSTVAHSTLNRGSSPGLWKLKAKTASLTIWSSTGFSVPVMSSFVHPRLGSLAAFGVA